MTESHPEPTSTEIVTLVCTAESFRPAPVEWVRWLALNADLYRIQQAYRTDGLVAPTYPEWERLHREGRTYCAAMVQNAIVAQAVVLRSSETEWELTEVWAQAAHRRKGYGKAACTFVTRYILDHQPQALCRIPADNAPMLRLAESLGYHRP